MGATTAVKEKVYVKATFERYLQDLIEEKGIDRKDVCDALSITGYRLTYLSQRPQEASGSEVVGLANLFGLDFWDELVLPFGLGKDRMTIAEAFNAATQQGGYTIAKVYNAA